MAKGKRTAGTDLNQDNWNDEEEESEDVGEFRKASNEILQQRVRKIAKRRIIDEEGNKKPASNPFGEFGGFGSSNVTISQNPSPFGFLAKIPSSTITSTPSATPSFSAKTNGESKTNSLGKPDSTEFLSKVKALNLAFVSWIKQHIDEDSLCDLTPVFKDYEKYIKEFEALKTTTQTTTEPPKRDSVSSFTFGKPSASANTPSINVFASKPASPVKISLQPALAPATKAAENKGFSFGSAEPNTQSTASSFSFGLQKTSTMNSSVVFGGFAAAPAFSFANVTQSKTETSKIANEDGAGEGEGEEESDEPPKNEFKPVVEEDSLYSKRCKVFVKTGADYSDRGVCTVFLKKVEDKLQMIARADTNLGNILLNIVISEGLPVSRMGKNNVMIVCVPTPDCKPTPVPVLIRVKTGDEADNLLAIIEKHKRE